MDRSDGRSTSYLNTQRDLSLDRIQKEHPDDHGRGLSISTETEHLPQPPSDSENVLYLGPQWRWIIPLSFLGYALIVLSVSLFVLRHPSMAFFLLPLAISGVGTTISLATSSRRRRDSLGSHRSRVSSWTPDRYPSVDVFLPSAGEDLSVLYNTYRCVDKLSWPGELRVYVLDDSGRHQVRLLAESFGFAYLSRENRGWFKKAGNLRYGFENSSGEVIMVLDADFVPRPDAVLQLAPYFDDDDVAIVQSPQFFDVRGGMNWLQRAAASTQILFYRWVQPSRDRSNAAICVGTSALYRRSALNKSGGFALIGHSEDVHTGVNLMKVGYRIRYVPAVVTKGLCPDTFDQFLTQQYRWCTGSMSLLFSRAFHRYDLTFMQRLCYWSGFLYYITTAINVFVMVLPPIFMGIFWPDQVQPWNYIFVALAMAVRLVVVPFITLERESLVGLTRIQATYSFAHALALVDVLRHRTDSWVATGSKQRSRTAERARRLIRVWALGVQVALWSIIVWRVPVYGLDKYWIMVLFAVVNAYLVYPLVFGDASRPTLVDVVRRGRRSLFGHSGVLAPVARVMANLLGPRIPSRSLWDGAPLGQGVRPAGWIPQPRQVALHQRKMLVRVTGSSALWLAGILALQYWLARSARVISTPFTDEGLYVYMGHRVWEAWAHGVPLHEMPASYFSGAPQVYPVLAAGVDSLGGLGAVRLLSLFFVMSTTVATYGLGERLFGKRAGILGAAAFSLAGPVIFQSQLATYDAMMMALVASAAWLAVRTAIASRLLWWPTVSVVLTVAIFTKYAAVAFVPVVAALAATAGWRTLGWYAVRRACYIIFGVVTLTAFVIGLWGGDLIHGVMQTTVARSVVAKTSMAGLSWEVATWIGLWVVLSVAGALTAPRRRYLPLSVVLLVGAVVIPLQQIRMGEQISLPKHCAFGLVFAAPLIGRLLSGVMVRAGRAGVVPLMLVFVLLAQVGPTSAHRFLTGWVPEDQLTSTLRDVLKDYPDKPILGENPSTQRYLLRDEVNSKRWRDTYYLSYGGKLGEAAYAEAIDQHYFGVIFLSIQTDYGAFVHNYLAYLSKQHYYKLAAKVPRFFRGEYVGDWLIYVADPYWRPSFVERNAR